MNATIRDLPLGALRALALVHAHGGVRAAARELGMSHSALSRHLAELEAWVGAPLTTTPRGRNGVGFTATGAALGRATRAALEEIDRTARALREARSSRSVVISTTASFATRWLLPRLSRAPVDLELSVIVDQRPVDLGAGEVDLALRMARTPAVDGDAEPLMDELLYPVASPAYWRGAGSPTRPSALTRLRLLHDRDPSAAWELWRAAHGPEALDVRRGPRFASSDLVLRAAALGQGVALARHRLAVDDLAAGALVRPFGDLYVALGPAYWVVLPPGGRHRPATAAAVAWLRREAAQVHHK